MALTRILGVAVVLGLIGAGGAFAQTVSAASPDSTNPAAPVAGANSFTEAQARSRLEAHGYTNVSELREDGQSIWRGKATKGGALVNVAIDYQGNIVPSK
jgi:poly(3-hydroxybutyrate) depolymerase